MNNRKEEFFLPIVDYFYLNENKFSMFYVLLELIQDDTCTLEEKKLYLDTIPDYSLSLITTNALDESKLVELDDDMSYLRKFERTFLPSLLKYVHSGIFTFPEIEKLFKNEEFIRNDLRNVFTLLCCPDTRYDQEIEDLVMEIFRLDNSNYVEEGFDKNFLMYFQKDETKNMLMRHRFFKIIEKVIYKYPKQPIVFLHFSGHYEFMKEKGYEQLQSDISFFQEFKQHLITIDKHEYIEFYDVQKSLDILENIKQELYSNN